MYITKSLKRFLPTEILILIESYLVSNKLNKINYKYICKKCKKGYYSNIDYIESYLNNDDYYSCQCYIDWLNEINEF